MELTPSILSYIEAHQEEAYQLLLTLAQIPAPSNHEEERAAFCKDWLDAQGATGVYTDEALNVVYPVGDTGKNPLLVVMAHSDVVFPDTTPLPLEIRDGRICCPGVMDDTANAVALMMAAKYIAETGLQPKGTGLLLVVNAGEEGLGNLKGCRKIMETYGSRVREFISFDDKNCNGVHNAVGSRRYRVEITTEGGHSFRDFGRPNAIACLSTLITDLYAMKIPRLGRTTFNVGTIQGGTSVNTIAQQAEMLFEFRSDEREALAILEEQFRDIVARHRTQGVEIYLTMVGDRPCAGDVDPVQMRELMDRAARAVERYYGKPVNFVSGSTDCNIPLSLGIPAVCVGCCFGDGAHTREEYVEIDSLLPGLKVAFDLVLHHF